MFIVTPVRHVERLSQLAPHEIYTFFLTASRLLDHQYASAMRGYLAKVSHHTLAPTFAVGSPCVYEKMTLNHGNERNLEHLHLKISIDWKNFSFMQRWGWTKDMKAAFTALRAGLYKEDERVQPV